MFGMIGIRHIATFFFIALVLWPDPAAAVEFAPGRHRTMFNKALPAEAGKSPIMFDDLLHTDWERLAKDHFTAYPLTGLSPAQIAELAAESDYSDIPVFYRAPVTEAYGRARFVFLTAGGMRSLDVTGMSGTVLYGLSEDRKAVVRRLRHFGKVVGVPEPSYAGGGFVAMLGEGQEFLGERRLSPGNPILGVANPMPGLKVSAQVEYRFSSDDSVYLFVQYEADTQCAETCCQFVYELFRKDSGTGSLTSLRSSMYACDV